MRSRGFADNNTLGGFAVPSETPPRHIGLVRLGSGLKRLAARIVAAVVACILCIWRSCWVRRAPARLVAAAAVASVVELTSSVWISVNLAADRVSALLESGEGVSNPLLGKTAIIKIDATHYEKAYRSRSPLDRAQLADDLEAILSGPSLQHLVVDLDLSPVDAESADDSPQKKLDAVVERHAAKLILLMPDTESVASDATRGAITKWQKGMQGKGVEFGHGNLVREMNVVRSYLPVNGEASEAGACALGLLLRQRLDGGGGAAKPVAKAASGANGICGGASSKSRPITPRGTEALCDKGKALSPDAFRTVVARQSEPKCLDVVAAVFGSGYSRDDQHYTAAGLRDGADLHAAIAVCPSANNNHARNFALEILVGAMLFAPIFEPLWRRYYQTLAGQRVPGAPSQAAKASATGIRRIVELLMPQWPSSAYGWLLATAAAVVVVLAGLIVMQVGVYAAFPSACAVGLVPGAMAIGMFFDAAVVSGTEVASHKLHGHAKAPWRRRLVHRLIFWGLYALLVGSAVRNLFH